MAQFEHSTVFRSENVIENAEGSIVSKILIKEDHGNIT